MAERGSGGVDQLAGGLGDERLVLAVHKREDSRLSAGSHDAHVVAQLFVEAPEDHEDLEARVPGVGQLPDRRRVELARVEQNGVEHYVGDRPLGDEARVTFDRLDQGLSAARDRHVADRGDAAGERGLRPAG